MCYWEIDIDFHLFFKILNLNPELSMFFIIRLFKRKIFLIKGNWKFNLKINLYSPEQKKKKEKFQSEKKTTGTDLVKLHSSIEKVKKFLPGVVNYDTII